MKIFLPDIHKSLTKNLCIYLKRLGHSVVLPSKEYLITEYPNPPVQQWCWNTTWTTETAQKEFGSNVICLSKSEVLDAKPDVLLITNYESQFEVLKQLLPNLPKSKVAFYSGNDYWEGWFDHSKYQNYLAADETGHCIAQKYKTANYQNIIPFVYPERSDSFEYKKYCLNNAIPLIGCYINDYQKNFPDAFAFYQKLKEIAPKTQYSLLENQPITKVHETMECSCATIHIKNLEGLGLATLESLAFGRPLILHRQLSLGKSLMKWSKQFQTCFFIENGRDYIEVIDAFKNRDFLYAAQNSAYSTVREIVCEEEQSFLLHKFLENLQ